MNCLQGFSYEESRNKHFEYCKDNETIRIEMPKKGSFVKFHAQWVCISECLFHACPQRMKATPLSLIFPPKNNPFSQSFS